MRDFSLQTGKRRTLSRRHRQSGYLLIEVMISVLILAIGLLGIAAMQASALRNSQSALQRSQAATQIHTILDAMRANRSVAMSGGYSLSRTCSIPSSNGLVGADLSGWIKSMHEMLGDSACGTIACNGAVCAVTIDWDDSRANDAGSDAVTAGESVYRISVSTRL